MCLRHHLDDLRKHRLAPDTFGLQNDAAGLVDGSAGNLIAGRLLHRHRLARDHRLIDASAAFHDLANHRNFFAGPHPKAIAALDLVERCKRAGRRIRTDDLLITNQLLYQLSYAGIYEGK